MKTIIKKEQLQNQIVENRIGIKIPDDCRIIAIKPEYVKVRRSDGLNVFLNENDDKRLNEIRLYEKDKRKIIIAVGLYRGMQIAENYRERYADELTAINISKLIEK